MIILQEENLIDWTSGKYIFTNFNDNIMVVQSHAYDKMKTNITPISSLFFAGRPLKMVDVINFMLALSDNKNLLQPALDAAEKDKDASSFNSKYKFAIHLYREIECPQHPEITGVLFYDFMVNVTAPYFNNERITSDKRDSKTWIDLLIANNPNISTLSRIKDTNMIFKPVILIQNFTGGFKPKPSKLTLNLKPINLYRGSVYDKQRSPDDVKPNYIDANLFLRPLEKVDEKDFEALISYQNQAESAGHRVVRAWDNVVDSKGNYPFSNIK